MLRSPAHLVGYSLLTLFVTTPAVITPMLITAPARQLPPVASDWLQLATPARPAGPGVANLLPTQAGGEVEARRAAQASVLRTQAHDAYQAHQRVLARKRRLALAAAARRAAPHAAPAHVQGPAYGGARAYALSLVGAAQFTCLDTLWDRESGWDTYATNPVTGAYGIPQALPGSKMAAAGADWQTNPLTQVRWGVKDYIDPVYGSPCAALAHSNATGWY